MAYSNELRYLLEDDDNNIELVHAVYFVSPIDVHLLYCCLFTQLLIACINSKNNSDVVIYITLIMKY